MSRKLPLSASMQEKNDRVEFLRSIMYRNILCRSTYSDCAPYVGSPPMSVLECNANHGVKSTCLTCHWNYCQFCTAPSGIVCVQCGTEPCKGCTPLSYPNFCGWTGVCYRCHLKGATVNNPFRDTDSVQIISTGGSPVGAAASSLPKVIQRGNSPVGSFQPIVPPASPPTTALCPGVHTKKEVCFVCFWNCCKNCGTPRSEARRVGGRDWDCHCGGSAVVINLCDTPPRSPPIIVDVPRRSPIADVPRSISEYLSNWAFWTQDADQERFVKPVKEHDFIVAILQEGIELGKIMSRRLAGYRSDICDIDVTIEEITRIEHPVLRDCFEAAVKKAIRDNGKRPEDERFKHNPVTFGFHGTDVQKAQQIMDTGFQVRHNVKGLYGFGTYTTRNFPLAVSHTHPDPVTGLCSVFVCRVLTGRYTRTLEGSRGPPENFDSGGDGTLNINVAYHDNYVYPEYYVTFTYERSTGSGGNISYGPTKKKARVGSPVGGII